MNNKKGIFVIILILLVVFLGCLAIIIFSDSGKEKNPNSSQSGENNSQNVEKAYFGPVNSNIDFLSIRDLINQYYVNLLENNSDYINDINSSSINVDTTDYSLINYYAEEIVEKELDTGVLYFVKGFLIGIDSSTDFNFIGNKNILIIVNNNHYKFEILPNIDNLTNFALLYDYKKSTIAKKTNNIYNLEPFALQDYYDYCVSLVRNLLIFKPENGYKYLSDEFKERNGIPTFDEFLNKKYDIINMFAGSFRGYNYDEKIMILLTNDKIVTFNVTSPNNFTIDIE